MSLYLKLIIIALKFIIPSLMLKFPFTGIWANYFLDIIDGDILRALGLSEGAYQFFDKLADFVSYIFMLILGLRFRISRIVVVLFIYRTIGQVLYFLTGEEIYFFYFQNFLEPLLLIYTYLIFKNQSEKKAFSVYKKHIVLIWGIILVYKIWNEWTLHFANIDLSSLFFGFSGGK